MMDVLRQMAIDSGLGAKEKNVLKFHEAFLSNIPGRPDQQPMMMVTTSSDRGPLPTWGWDRHVPEEASLVSPDEGHGKRAPDLRQDPAIVIRQGGKR
jgi:hypothetical protein